VTAFGQARIRKGLRHFLVGKGVSACAGFAAMVLVVRALPVPEFAAYSVLVALVEVFTALSGMGLSHVILRYVPELYSLNRLPSLRTLVGMALGLRSLVLLMALLIAFFAASPLAVLIGLHDMLPAVKLFFLVVGLRSTSHFLSQILESTLHQGYSQLGFALAAIGRCLGMLWLLHIGAVSLINVIALEAACDLLACLVLSFGLAKVLYLTPAALPTQQRADRVARLARGPIARFAATAYLQHLATLPFGGNTNRLVGGAMFGDRQMASFGFALSLYDYAKRYLPTQLLIGMIRPIVVARFTQSRSFSSVATLCEQSFQVNLLVLLGGMVLLAVGGPELLGKMSAGKYGTESAILLMALLVVLILETQRLVLEVLAQTVERYDLMIASNLLLSSSVLLGIFLYPVFGVLAFPGANALALVLANFSTIRRLAKLGFQYKADGASSCRAGAVFAAAVAVGLGLKYLGVHWLVSTAVAMMMCALLFVKFQLAMVRAYTLDLVGRH
jgi:O-antigen/teichoic acid export membrane protein